MAQTNYEDLTIAQLQSKANAGDANAQSLLGVLYYHGDGVTQSYTEAAKWCRKAAEQGDLWSQTLLGMMYFSGDGVPQNYTEAVKWFRKAAEHEKTLGSETAPYYLGKCHYDGKGVPQDYTEAAKWYRKAAEQGSKYAQCELGKCYEEGNGVTQSYTEAVKWYRMAAELGYAVGQLKLGFCYCVGQGVPQDYTEAAKWWRKAAEQGEERAELLLAMNDEEIKAAERSLATSQQSNTYTPNYSGTSSTSSTYSGSTYTPRSTYKYRSHRSKENLDWVGLSLGYVQKRWRYKDGEVESVGAFDDQKLLNGVQVGLTLSPKFVAGFGIQTGLFYEYFYAKSSEYSDYFGNSFHSTYNEHNFYVPLHLKYDFNLGNKIYLGVFGGAGFDCIAKGVIKLVDTYSDESYDDADALDSGIQKRFNASWEVGATFRYRNFQLGYTYSRGILNHADDDTYEVKQNKPMRLNMTLFF